MAGDSPSDKLDGCSLTALTYIINLTGIATADAFHSYVHQWQCEQLAFSRHSLSINHLERRWQVGVSGGVGGRMIDGRGVGMGGRMMAGKCEWVSMW